VANKAHHLKFTTDCQYCHAESEVVCNPRTKTWVCFNCWQKGSYTLVLTATSTSPDDPDGHG
jgi:hypothetical protein